MLELLQSSAYSLEELFVNSMFYHFFDSISQTLYTFPKDSFFYSYSTNFTFIFTIKVTFFVCFLILIRGGVPRYRYDFLTKIGWVKFLLNVLGYFVLFFVLYLLF